MLALPHSASRAELAAGVAPARPTRRISCASGDRARTVWSGREGMELTEGAERISGRARFRRANRLRSARDIARARRGSRQVGTYLTVSYTRQEEPGPARIGFSVSKRVGGAVVRNRVKRRLREAIRPKVTRLAPGWDMLLTARSAAAQAPFAALADEVEALLARASLVSRHIRQGTP
ncbi:MAG TPA: ribonuclease P protein component [Ktedonobacterales bacterium]|nr:ribonuclease P protein component [Ktedonobacterales bacterium]